MADQEPAQTAPSSRAVFELFENAPVALAQLAPDGRSRAVNRRYRDLFGHAEGLAALVALDPDLQSPIDTCEPGGTAIAGHRIVRDRSEGALALSVTVARDASGHWLIEAEDIGGRVAAERVARQAQRAGEIWAGEVADAALVRLDAGAAFIAWNGSCRTLLGYTESEIMGRPLADLVPEDAELKNTLAGHLETLRDSARTRFHGWLMRADGRRLWCDVRLERLGEGLNGLAGVIADAGKARIGAEAAEDGPALDAASGLMAAGRFADRLDREVARFRRFRAPFSLIVLDLAIDGSAPDDGAAAEIGTLCRKELRPTDAAGRPTPGRFAVALGSTVADAAEIVAERLRDLLSARFPGIAMAIGIAEVGAGIADGGALMALADDALSAAESLGSGQIVKRRSAGA